MNKPRLIDANKLIEYIEKDYDIYADDIVDIVKDQPTAYDVQEVLEKLNEWRNDIAGLADENEWYSGVEQGYINAMALVKGNCCENGNSSKGGAK